MVLYVGTEGVSSKEEILKMKKILSVHSMRYEPTIFVVHMHEQIYNEIQKI